MNINIFVHAGVYINIWGFVVSLFPWAAAWGGAAGPIYPNRPIANLVSTMCYGCGFRLKVILEAVLPIHWGKLC